ncbi:hypothetical protein BU24DRAFT_449962 [Aaosphaeria arxii CBS 175.79]|uniref:protein-ribulosamine 3-kinase n=1 Tax=Aaosphaeria arxii CBS 175.79 TaxID=1450172 RepID=A0A6A5XR14_9PLEO|nr:uncharacterized protein BU24DRAFT_449962 [Aaosphaeria arxii CBS 175.79]KAF2015201.1 hypothetical protein BU24DRAFT_449962 [Aaosphaeria arxii CBS 175.79]
MNYEGAPGLDFGGGNVKIDPSVTKVLPQGCRVISTETHGVSFWANTGRIDVELCDGSAQSFFIKVESHDVGKNMLSSEFESMKAIHRLAPDFAPEPIAWGTYELVPENHFFVSKFHDMRPDMPDPGKFAARLSALHQSSRSPNGKFGFHVTTYAGNLPQYTEWEDKWEIFFSKSLRKALDLEIEAKGYDPEFDTLIPAIFNKVIPRLLRPLESEGRSVKPSLVHGDLWYANSGIESDTGEALVFDACCFYAHNEYEFGQWRPACNRFGAKYLDAYHACAPISSPKEDFDGRVDLYKLRYIFDKSVALKTSNLS